jgi:serine/threonine-protein kinase/endoribonuclease IRE1
VYKGMLGNREVAVKRLLTEFYKIVDREVSLLEENDAHPNVVRYFFREKKENFYYIALELCDTSLYNIVTHSQALNPDLVRRYKISSSRTLLHQIISGVEYLHRMNVVHRDIKPQNILILLKGDTLNAKISDFGLSKKLEEGASSFYATRKNSGGTPGWRAPELLEAESLGLNSSFSYLEEDNNGQTRRFTKALDVFAVGCLFHYVLSSGKHPFGTDYERDANILSGKDKIEDSLDVEAKDLVKKMINKDPKAR